MRNPNPYSCIWTNSNLFQPNIEVSACCPNDAAMCKPVEKSRPGSNEEISLHSTAFCIASVYTSALQSALLQASIPKSISTPIAISIPLSYPYLQVLCR